MFSCRALLHRLIGGPRLETNEAVMKAFGRLATEGPIVSSFAVSMAAKFRTSTYLRRVVEKQPD
jgi:hypothetical protein